MSMDVDESGFNAMKVMLEKLKGVPGIADTELKKIAKEIQVTARNMAPVEYGDLKAAIVIRRRGGGRNAKGQFTAGQSTYEIVINNNQPVKDSNKRNKTVGEYAWKVHEHMGWGSHYDVIMPSKVSIAAGLAHGEEAGGKFMERAFIRFEPKVKNRLAAVIRKYYNQIK